MIQKLKFVFWWLQIRYPLMREVQRQMGAKNKRRAPEPTTKQGKLKADRKAKLQRIYLDDLASLENFSIVMKILFFLNTIFDIH